MNDETPRRDDGTTGIERHTHVWHFIFANTRGGWNWHCPCGAYRNNDGRVSDARR